MKVTGNPRHLSKHRTSTVFGPILSDKRYIIHDSNLTNVKRGLVERVFRVKDKDGLLKAPPLPNDMVFKTRLRAVRSYLADFPKMKPLPLHSTLNLWHGSKLKVYQRAYDSLLVKSLTRSDAWLKTFVKCEKIDADKEDPAPRIIQPRNPRYNLCLARFLKHNEHEYYSRIDRMFDRDGIGDKTIFKGLNAVTAAEHLRKKTTRFNSPVFVGLDASRFDQHVSRTALEWEHSIYTDSMSYGVEELQSLLSWQRHNIGVAYLPEGKIKYETEGVRASGDINTSLGNCLLMSSMVYSYCRSKNLRKFSLANNGDDCVLIVEKHNLSTLDDLPQWFLEMGFSMKVEKPVYDLSQVEFCQTNVVIGDQTSLCVRNPRTVLSKDLHSTHSFQHGEYLEWLSSVGECGRNSSFGVPVLQAFYNKMPTLQLKSKRILYALEQKMKYTIRGGVAPSVEIDDTMRHSFWKAFGITPDCQIALEHLLDNVTYTSNVGIVSHNAYAPAFQGCKFDTFTQIQNEI